MALTEKLTAIGEAIREKTGSTALLTLDEMPTAIQSIEGGGNGEDGINSDRGAADGIGYFIISDRKAITSSTTSFTIDVSDYISDTSKITSILGAAGYDIGNGAVSYWNRELSPNGETDTFVGDVPTLFRRDYSTHDNWSGIDGGTILTYNNKISKTMIFDRFLIRYSEV